MKTFVLMAGGTGGHLFPAMALAQELIRRGHAIELMTDHRAETYGGNFPARETHIIPSATPSLRNPVKFVTGGFRILRGIAVALGKLNSIKPDAVIGFGGYPTFPPFVAASLLGIPGILHEQNAVMGRANRALGRFADILAMSYDKTRFAEALNLEKQVTGNPVRDKVRALAGTPYPALADSGPLRLFVVAGSQGARAFSDIVPEAIGLLPDAIRSRLQIAQQCRSEDLDRVADTYRQLKVNVELATFFEDLPERVTRSHLLICRSGASTIADACVLGRPMILVPLPGSLDADQKNNALVVENAGAGWIAEQATLSPQSLATRLTTLLTDPATLTKAADAARSLGQPRAVEKLADLAEMLSGKNIEVDHRS
ncbi:undecaprenyldiphospho-muramoylpentapeptide beta-N-acetylglucosaminyltransferase [Devosia sp. Root635]|uniref:undecaprenyldiphospho-muramoylpentapeptide beta-N-acetylglucosaminyltransferase n=1 Tax=Devosia sp. Root635 TaxID=1736575 RepID=UPI000700BB9F|nr:undecaprenyldiphospho-muramoylpentapeptide beta-N-acetylglucosaminyltransferase [Devosia sp. Root635]KRA50230.1 UDP-N-acetylglucosamine--N-acetylmuramyl-(pentapeptide) pyrophosphoryl-undecaprenol N-acetylglucosamine transferase [Devosia sp. Root635]